MPPLWRTAAASTMMGESIEHLGLTSSHVDLVESSEKPVDKPVLTRLSDTLVGISFGFNHPLKDRFKAEVDGRKWDGDKRMWKFAAVKLPKVVELFGGTKNVGADEGTKELYREEIARRKELDEIRVKTDTDIKIPTLLDLYPYQKVAVEFIERAGGRAMVADAMGLGKTATAIGYAVYKTRRTLIVCPKSVKVNWQREIKRFAGKDACIWESDGKKGRINAQFHVINYDIVDKHAQKLNDLKFNVLVCDEATYLKNRQSKRAKAVLGYYKERSVYPGIKTPEVIFLTGTPVLNRPIEAYTLLNFLDGKRFDNFYHFTQNFGGYKGEPTRNLGELHQNTKDLVIRRLKSEVLKELPDKQRNDLVVEMSPVDQKQYDTLLKKLFRKWGASGKPSVSDMPEIQSFLIEKKMPRVIEMIDELLEADRSVLVFSCYIDPLHALNKHYGDKSAMLYGAMNTKKRQVSIDALKEGTAKVGLFGIKSGGMGIDGLQHSIDTVIFLDQDWVPANHEQAEDRAHRIGQKNQVQIFYMICESTIDEYMREILVEKQRIIDTVVDGKLVSGVRSKSVFKEFVKRLSAAYKTAQMGNVDDADDVDNG
jgi:SWI/SNF-related matrix-associated actin-dependent regulator 1 of chromatin subfamily A